MDHNTTAPRITLDTLVLKVVESYPQTIAVFNDLSMACPGCHISPFHTVAESACEYGLHPGELLNALNDVLASGAALR